MNVSLSLLGEFPALSAGNRAIRSNKFWQAKPVKTYSASIPCAEERFGPKPAHGCP
jgi:hypothetical protein